VRGDSRRRKAWQGGKEENGRLRTGSKFGSLLIGVVRNTGSREEIKLMPLSSWTKDR